MTTFLRQADDRWRGNRLGLGTSTYGGAACLLMSITDAARHLLGSDLDPRDLNDACVKAGAFVDSGLIVDKAAAIAGLRAGPRVEQPVGIMSRMVQSYLASGRLLLLHVDHDSAKPKGDPEADHWVWAFEQVGSLVIYGDPATGEPGGLDAVMLTGASAWRDKRLYAVRAFRTLTKA